MADLPFPCAYRGRLWCASPWSTASPSRYVRFPRPRCGFPSVPIVNVELHENMEFACPPSISVWRSAHFTCWPPRRPFESELGCDPCLSERPLHDHLHIRVGIAVDIAP